jgi:hypothetical protein
VMKAQVSRGTSADRGRAGSSAPLRPGRMRDEISPSRPCVQFLFQARDHRLSLSRERRNRLAVLIGEGPSAFELILLEGVSRQHDEVH